MIIGVPKEIKPDEYRVAMTPSGVCELVRAGHRILVETVAGEGSGFDDVAYARAGAEIVGDVEELYRLSDMIVKVKEPLEIEYDRLQPGQILFTYLHLAADKRLTEMLCEKNIAAFAYETLAIGGRLPLLEPMSEIAGKMATLYGALHLGRYFGGSGLLIGGALGTERTGVVILGGGVAGKSAAQSAAALGADVVLMDVNLRRLEYLRDILPPNVTVRLSTHDAIASAIAEADIVIGTVLIPGAKAPKLITRSMLSTMRKGSVLVDVSIDQGGCFETSHPTTHSHPTFVVDDVVHYCVANMPGMYPRTSTLALAQATVRHIQTIASTPLSSLLADPVYRSSLNTYEGAVTNTGVAQAHSMPCIS